MICDWNFGEYHIYFAKNLVVTNYLSTFAAVFCVGSMFAYIERLETSHRTFILNIINQQKETIMRMKKLFTLLLVTMGMVCTVSATDYLNFYNGSDWNETQISYDAGGFGAVTITGLSASTKYWFYIKKEDGGTTYWKNNATMSETDYNWKFTQYNGGNNGSFTTTIAGNYTIIVKWYDDGGNNWFPHISIVYPKANEYTVHFKKPAGWSSVYAQRFFNGTEFYDKVSPGTELSQNSINSDFYDVTFSDNINSIIFSDNGDGEKKTSSIAIDFSSTEYWVTDNATASSTLPADDYKYTRSVTPGSYGTICLPYNATIEGATVYSIAAIQEEVDEPKRLCFVEKENVIAGYAYLFQAGEGNQLTATFTSNTKTSKLYDDGMLGNLSPDPIILNGSKTAYVIQGNVIKKVVDGGTGVSVPQYRAYITLSNITTSAPSLDSNFIFIPFEDAPSGINTVQISESKINGYYNLNGQRVAQPTKGLYIVNGKKVVLK